MDTALSRHYARVRHLREAFAEANERLVSHLRGADDHSAEQSGADGGWSAARAAWHVARVTTRFAGLMSGDVPGVEPLPDDFAEREWRDVAGRIPPRLQTSAAFVPPPSVRRMDAIAALEASAVRMAQALDAVTADRGARFGISSPMVGAITVYQIGEWAIAHVLRHTLQAERALGRADGGRPSHDAC